MKWNAANPFFSDRFMPIVDSFAAIQEGVDTGTLSGSLIYRLAEPEFGIMTGSVLGSLTAATSDKPCELTPDKIERLIQIFAREISHSGALTSHFSGNGNKENQQLLSRTLAAHMAGITLRRKTTGEGEQALADEVAHGWIYNGQVPAIARYLTRGGAGVKGGETL